ncbi:hypothetical protein M406DRAFT_327050 [Cryphonectria parasitica EP155]|uniref:C2H2-type domain-containing protein n=1 Tax=Cryphonectria parasitica (strain ATCC 38755 / EP155) TaxID=660469 RepID=A0A9P4Y8S8_CRYP1|nr:uncharacterized protein M406DRAFT_327050 [Cryphonectria parasitica EP155]KAF3768623.1 hypothetical protein M406DRAFT_327050 [Cryphonectria parasitica EP155]
MSPIGPSAAAQFQNHHAAVNANLEVITLQVHSQLSSGAQEGPSSQKKQEDTAQSSNPPFFRLTTAELLGLQRRYHKNKAHNFRDVTSARELEARGRGWDVFSRARKKSEKQGTSEDFKRRIDDELDHTLLAGLESIHAPSRKMKGKPDDLQVGKIPRSCQTRKKCMSKTKERKPEIPQEENDESPRQDQKLSKITQLRYRLAKEEEEAKAKKQDEMHKANGKPTRELHLRVREKSLKTTKASSSVRGVYDSLQPRFSKFLCEWEGCPVELMNFDTLKRHLHKVHCKAAQGDFTCLWGAYEESVGGGQDMHRKVYQTGEELASHVDDVHLTVQAWHMGDGQGKHGMASNADAADKLPAYLFEQHGKRRQQVTPSVKDQRIETPVGWRQRKKAAEARFDAMEKEYKRTSNFEKV